LQVFDGATQRESWHRKLTKWVDSIFSAIDDADFVVLSTHRHTHAIPWAAIPYKGKPLGVKFAFCTVPSLNALSKIVGYPQDNAQDYSGNLVVGDPLGDLPGAKNEAEIVGQILQSPVLIGNRASIKEIKKMLPFAKYVHFATHAKYNFLNPLASSFSLSDEYLYADDILQIDMKPELLIASACDTGKGEVQIADEIIGLAHVLLMAGAKSVVASLWRISDSEPTVRFMEVFYESLQKGKSKAFALREAMAKIYQHWPQSYYWAPFILMGDWQ
jgi:CHAT domain-containing protein